VGRADCTLASFVHGLAVIYLFDGDGREDSLEHCTHEPELR
jgi:hypothetical protein